MNYSRRKIMKARLFFAAAITLACIGGCDSSPKVAVSSLSGVMDPVLDRHDAYVSVDEALSPVERDTFLRSTTILRELMATTQD